MFRFELNLCYVIDVVFYVQLEHLREKLKDKEGMVDKKSKQALAAQLDKKRIEGEFQELQNHQSIKDRKISVLQRKVCTANIKFIDSIEHTNQLHNHLFG